MKTYWVASLLYAAAAILRNLMFDIGILKTRRLPAKVISVGNITAGGTGKTPLTLHIGEYLRAKGVRFGVLSRGYGRKALRPFMLDSSKNVSASDIGDEPKMIGEKLGCCLGIGADRFRVGGLLLKKYGTMPLILDDGFAHRYLARDLNLVTLAEEDPFSKGFLPYGHRREPLRGLRRADGFVIMRNTEKADDEAIRSKLEKLGITKPVFNARRVPECLITPEGTGLSLEKAEGMGFYLFSGIAGGERFVSFVESLDLGVKGHVLYADHFRFDKAEMDQIRQNAGSNPILTTEKDFWRLEDLSKGVHYLKIRLAFDQDEAFRAFLAAALT